LIINSKKTLLLFTLLSSTYALGNAEVDIKLGEKLYKQTCLACHGKNGDSKNNLDLVVNSRELRKTILTQEQAYQTIKEGGYYWGAYANVMPAFKYIFEEKELLSISKYISETFNKDIENKIETLYSQSDKIPQKKKAKMLKRGEKIYKRNCHWCHGTTGKGDGEATRNPDKSIYPYDLTKTLLTPKQMFLYAKYGGKFWGTHKDDMPSWKKKYNDFDLKSVVEYINKVIRK
jgi:mono/diheme cytochrome c family protein